MHALKSSHMNRHVFSNENLEGSSGGFFWALFFFCFFFFTYLGVQMANMHTKFWMRSSASTYLKASPKR